MGVNSYLAPHQEGTIISIRVTPRSKKIGPLGLFQGCLKWGVSAPPSDGEANAALLDGISDFLRCAKSRISIVKGERSRVKLLLLSGFSLEDVAARFEEILTTF